MAEGSLPEVSGAESPARRSFLKAAAGLLAGVAAAVAAAPVVWMLVGGIFRREEVRYTAVASLASLPEGQPVDISFEYKTEEAYLQQSAAHDLWVIKHSPTEVTVFSPICPHLGCHYDWDASTQRFVCPCHGSIFLPDGTVVAGPAPRPLDTLPHKIEDGQLLVAWERFEPGIPQKIVV